MHRISAPESGGNLLRILLKAGIFVDNPCNGNGTCGKCRVKVLAGRVSPLTETEKKLLRPEEMEEGIRLACLTRVYGEAEVEPLEKERSHRVLTEGKIPEFEKDHFTEGCGAAVDIGTTTVVVSLVDLKTGRELASAARINAQKHFGVDVLTRITYEYENPETGVRDLQKAIVDSLNGMLAEVCEKSGTAKSELKEIVVAANCTMMHMLLGTDARPIGRAPYRPVFLEAKELTAQEIGIEVSKETKLYCLPQVSAFIGADIVAGAYVCGLQKRSGNVLFIDIGTNGELVLSKNGKLFCCSCAAGPALEGMNISCGMRAAQGAVEDIHITKNGVSLEVIGGGEPAGLCGSGILSTVKELLRTGILKKTGAFIKREKLSKEDYRYGLIRMNGVKREFLLREDPLMIVTQGDVRQVQLAKGAILSGITALIKRAGLRVEELDEVIIAGQFGAHLPVDSLVQTGILPGKVEERIVYVGNSSKTGAYMALMSQQARKEMQQLAGRMEYMELAETENYERLFAECMTFPDLEEK